MKVDIVSHYLSNDKGFQDIPVCKRIYINGKFTQEFKDATGKYEEVKKFIRDLFKKQAIDIRYVNRADK